MFKKPTKKQMLIRRIILSIITTVAVLIIVTFSILFMLGYRLDSGNGRLEQGALLQFNSRPSGATVSIDGRSINAQTSTKQTVLPGIHSIRFSREGYEEWNRTLQLEAGTLTWLDYARLVPSERPVQSVRTFEELAAVKFSPDMKWGLAQLTFDTAAFELLDLRAQDVRSSTLTLNNNLYSESTTPDVAHRFTIHAWGSDGRYAIIKHTVNDQTEWLMLDTQDVSRSINITRSLSVNLVDVQFSGTSGMGIYGLTNDEVVRKLDLAGGTISRGLVTHVKSFSVFKDSSTVSYTGLLPSDPTKPVVGIYKDGDSESTIVRTAETTNTKLKIAIGRYFSDDYMAVSEDSVVTLLTGSLPSAGSDNDTMRQVTTFSLAGPIDQLSFSPASDFVLAQSGTTFTSFEVEHLRAHPATVAIPEGKAPAKLKWLDSWHLWNDDMSQVTMRDFDGTNIHNLMTAEPGYDATLSQNGRFLYSIGKSESGQLQLQRIRMILE